MPRITITTTKSINALAGNLLEGHLEELDEAYLASGDEPLKINLGFKITPSAGGHKIEGTIGFVTGKVKDSGVIFVDEEQTSLLEGLER